MKKVGLFYGLAITLILLSGCFVKVETNPSETKDENHIQNKYLTAFGTEPFWDIEISGGIAKLSSPMYDTDYSVPVNIRKEGENYYFSGEELEGEFIKKDCIDGGKGDMHYYTVGVAKFREYYYEGCGDDEEGIKMSDEDVPSDYYQYQPDEEETNMKQLVEERSANGFKDVSTCMQTLNEYDPEWMPGDPQTIITVGCGPENYGDKYITGYLYTSTYPDLGLRITTPKGYDTFYKKSEKPIFIRNGNRISYGNDNEYLEVFEKSENENLEKIIKEKHLNNNCYINEYEGEQNKVRGHNENKIYNIVDSNNINRGDCIADNESTEQDYRIARYFESPDKTKYYKLVFTEGCAPGPCSMFGEVEIF